MATKRNTVPKKSRIPHAPVNPPPDNSREGILARMQAASDQGNPYAAKRARFSGRRCKLIELFESGQDATYMEMLQLIRLGCHDHVAASCMGITPQTWINWLNKGRESRAGIYRQLYLDVNQAKAQSRSLAEAQVRQNDPLAWLRLGPGRSKPGLDGWTETINMGTNPDSPLQINVNHKHDGRIQLEHAHAHLVINKNLREGETLLAEALAYGEEAGLLARTEHGAKLFLSPREGASSDSEPSPEDLQPSESQL